MSTDTKIEWCDHTFNGWWGCSKVHTGCANCYAEDQDKRWTHKGQDPHWGPKATRRFILGSWSLPAKWDAEALEKLGQPARVFASSMCDVFEDFTGDLVNQQGEIMGCFTTIDGSLKVVPQTHGDIDPLTLDVLRQVIFEQIEQTPSLQWLLLTKRPENITRMVPEHWLNAWPTNVMTGYSASDQVTLERGIQHLISVPGRHFLSLEPLVGPIDLLGMTRPAAFHRSPYGWEEWFADRIHWVIAGGESGDKARPMHPDWARSLRDQCAAAGVPFFFKQWGEYAPRPKCDDCTCVFGELCCDRRGVVTRDDHVIERVGKKAAGRLLDDVEHNGFPETTKREA